MNFNPDYENIATAFIGHYYSQFDQSDAALRAQGLGDLYDPEHSYMSFEGVQCRGREGILAKFSVCSSTNSCFSSVSCSESHLQKHSTSHHEMRFSATLRRIYFGYGSRTIEGNI